MPTYQFNPADMLLTIDNSGDTHIVQGYAPDTFLRCSKTEQTWTARSSSDGTVVTRSKRNNHIGEVTFTLEAGAPSNDWLQDLLDRDVEDESGVCSVGVSDNNGNERAHAAEAWLMRQPDNEYGADAGTRTWTLQCANMRLETRGARQLSTLGISA